MYDVESICGRCRYFDDKYDIEPCSRCKHGLALTDSRYETAPFLFDTVPFTGRQNNFSFLLKYDMIIRRGCCREA